jgi:GAF domain-containing protein
VARLEHRGQTPNSPYRDPSSTQIGGAVDWTGDRDLAAAGTVGGNVEAHFHAALAADGMCAALAFLNARTRYRFTGLYRLEPPLLRNECLFDRENPSLSLGGETTPLAHTYCGIVAATHSAFLVDDSRNDARLTTHPARASVVSYVGVPIRAETGRVIGTLCHFDLRPRILPLDELTVLESISLSVSEWLSTGRSQPPV